MMNPDEQKIEFIRTTYTASRSQVKRISIQNPIAVYEHMNFVLTKLDEARHALKHYASTDDSAVARIALGEE